MNYEQKYKEALERARKIENGEPLDVPDGTSISVAIFPELKESEDKRIRKQIISFLKEFEHDHYRCLDFSSWIAWLEKQGKQIDIANKEYWRGYREGKQEILDKYTELEKQGEQKANDKVKQQRAIEIPFGAKDSELQEATYYIPDGYHAEINGNEVIIKKGEQKSSWSEEDEKKRMLLIRILEVNHPNGYFKVNPANTLNMEVIHTEELVSWLKSL